MVVCGEGAQQARNLGSLMTINVFQFTAWDHQNGASITVRRRSTAERIATAKGKVLPATVRSVDEDLVRDGRTILDPDSLEATMLSELSKRVDGRAQSSGNKDRTTLRSMADAGLITSRSLSLDTVEYEITPLGRRAVEQLL